MKILHNKILIILAVISVIFCNVPASAADRSEIDALFDSIPSDWPQAPETASQAAILMDVDTGTILYAKNATKSMYPASTTKLMTALLTLENCKMDEIVTFSKNSIYSLIPGSSHIGMQIGESLSVEDCLYGLLLPSANEVATALAEHVSGSVKSFVNLMNTTAAKLGCVNTNFANANGLHDTTHYSCAYDLSLIMKACIQSSDFIRISSRAAYYREPDDILPRAIPMGTTNQLIKKDSEFYCDMVVCGKTGWTEEAGRCLATYSVKGSRRLICVVMNSEAPNQYLDTINLINYGFDKFSAVNVSLQDPTCAADILSSQSPIASPSDGNAIIALDSSACITLPSNVSIDNLTRSLETDEDGSHRVVYSLSSYPLGSAGIVNHSSSDSGTLYDTDSVSILSAVKTTPLHTINLWFTAIIAVTVLILILLLFFLIRYMRRPAEDPDEEEKDSKDRYHFQ